MEEPQAYRLVPRFHLGLDGKITRIGPDTAGETTGKPPPGSPPGLVR